MLEMTWIEDANYLTPVELELINKAIVLSNSVVKEAKNRVNADLKQQYLYMLDALASVRPDATIIAAAILYPYVNYADLTIDAIREELGLEVAKVVAGVVKMAAIGNFAQYKNSQSGTSDYEQLRKMLCLLN